MHAQQWCLGALLSLMFVAPVDAERWPRHVIDESSRGADGVRVADVDGDQRMDIATGWEEGGVVRLYVHPGFAAVRRPWPQVTVGRVASPEDATLVDLDGDGAMDIVSCCEGRTRSVFVHWSPAAERRLNEKSWTTTAIPQLRNQQWMYCSAADCDNRHGTDLIVGSKGQDASVVLLLSPEQPRQLDAWSVHRLRPAGWIMSLVATDFDQDRDLDLLLSDRRGANRGVFWLENPGPVAVVEGQAWKEHLIGGTEKDVMFLSLADLDGDGSSEVLVAAQDATVEIFRRRGSAWSSEAVALPAPFQRGKAVAASDIDGDGRVDLVVTTEDGLVAWAQSKGEPLNRRWTFHDISGGVGYKFDRVELLDMDGDGDDDVLTCEERHNLGVVWYENPFRHAESRR